MKHQLWDKTTIKELGEPIIYSEYQKWIIGLEGEVLTGFLAYEETNNFYKLNYLYVLPEFRRLGVASQLYRDFEKGLSPDKPIRTVTTIPGVEFFKKLDFKIITKFVNYYKIEK